MRRSWRRNGRCGARCAWWPNRAARRRSRRCYRGPTGRRRENASGCWFAEPTPRRWSWGKVGRTPGPGVPSGDDALVGSHALVSWARSGSRGTRADEGVRPTFALPQPPHVFQRPINENRFAVDLLALDEAPRAAVAGGTAVIAQHEILAGRDAVFFPGDAVAIVLGNVALGQQVTVDVDLAGIDVHEVAGQADDALDVGFLFGQRKPEHHHVAPLDAAQAEEKSYIKRV